MNGLSARVSRSTPLPRGMFLNCPLAIASSIRSFANAASPVTVFGMALAPGAKRSLNSRFIASRSASLNPLSLTPIPAYACAFSRAPAARRPALMPTSLRIRMSTGSSWMGFGLPRNSGAKGLRASSSIRKTASSVDSCPVHACAEAMARVPSPAESGMREVMPACSSAAACSW